MKNLIETNFDCFRFLVADRKNAYICIMLALFHERQAYQIEIFHDELYTRICADIEKILDCEYPEVQFRSDIDSLVEWGNIIRKLEGRRIRSLGDNSLRRNILKVSEESFQLIRYLITQTKPRQRKTAARGFMLLEDLSNSLGELEKLQDLFLSGNCSEQNLQRSFHLINTIDEKIDEAVAELTGLADGLHSFLDINEDFQADSFNALVSQLDSYNKSYLSRLTDMANQLFSRLKIFQRHSLHEQFLETIEDLAEVSDSDYAEKIGILIDFFDPASGKLNFYCRRINTELGDAIRRIRNYMRIRKDRSLRVQEIRMRTKEMFNADDVTACAWIEQLYSPFCFPTLLADGTPDNKSLAPSPRKSSSKVSTWRNSSPLKEKKMSLQKSRELEQLRIKKLNLFFKEKVLQNKNENHLQNASLQSIDDLQKFMTGLKLVLIKSPKKLNGFDISIEKPLKENLRACFSDEDFEFECPDHIVRNKE